MSELFAPFGWAFLAAEMPPLAKPEPFGALDGRRQSCSDEQVVATSKSSESSVATDPDQLHCCSGLLFWQKDRSCEPSGPNSGRELLLPNCEWSAQSPDADSFCTPLQVSSHEDGLSSRMMFDSSKNCPFLPLKYHFFGVFFRITSGVNQIDSTV